MTLPLMIFAAGFGTRMGALTADRPKPMLELAGRTMIDRAIDLGEEAGCAPILANTHYRAEVIAPTLAARGVGVCHEPVILDTGGGLKAALSRLGDGRVATLNPDVAWSGPNPLRHLLDTAWPDDAGALLLLIPETRATGRSGPGDIFSLNAAWTALAGEGRLHGAVYPGRWCDAGSPEGLRAADALLRETA
jgi:N-acetyl-alpha-D-muramate 1-phosphate uridylyltransferase